MRQRPEYGSWKTNSANCAANDHLKQPARQSRPSFSPRERGDTQGIVAHAAVHHASPAQEGDSKSLFTIFLGLAP